MTVTVAQFRAGTGVTDKQFADNAVQDAIDSAVAYVAKLLGDQTGNAIDRAVMLLALSYLPRPDKRVDTAQANRNERPPQAQQLTDQALRLIRPFRALTPSWDLDDDD